MTLVLMVLAFVLKGEREVDALNPDALLISESQSPLCSVLGSPYCSIDTKNCQLTEHSPGMIATH